MGCKWGVVAGLATCSLLFQNCGQSFEHIDPDSKTELLQSKSVFQGQAKFIYFHGVRKLRAVEDLAGGGSGEIPAQGPNGEGVIIVSAPGTFGPGSGVIPISAGAAYGETSVVNGVSQGPNWYVPPTVTITQTTTTDNGGEIATALFGAFMGMIGAISNSTSGTTTTNYQAYVPTSGGGGYTTGSGGNAGTSAPQGNAKCAANDIACQEWGIPQCADLNNIDSDPNFLAGKCHSPLLIAFDEDQGEFRSFELTDPLRDGRWFDIAGARAQPMAHAKNLISWLRKPSYMFITLPNAQGKVTGIDELFGNNTRGPDGEFAPNGYEALRKFDVNGDGYISFKDPVFEDLRLWSDVDADAVAGDSELKTLREMNIEVIDLHYDANYVEADRYGNLTALKSAVRAGDGRLHLLFDLWFRIP